MWATTAKQMPDRPKNMEGKWKNNWTQLGDKGKTGGRKQLEDMRETSARQIETNEKNLKDKWQRAELDWTQIRHKCKEHGTQMGQRRGDPWKRHGRQSLEMMRTYGWKASTLAITKARKWWKQIKGQTGKQGKRRGLRTPLKGLKRRKWRANRNKSQRQLKADKNRPQRRLKVKCGGHQNGNQEIFRAPTDKHHQPIWEPRLQCSNDHPRSAWIKPSQEHSKGWTPAKEPVGNMLGKGEPRDANLWVIS